MCGEKVFLYNNPPPLAMRRAVAGGKRRRRLPRTAPSLSLRLVRGYSFSCPQGALRPDFQSIFIYYHCLNFFQPLRLDSHLPYILPQQNTEEDMVTFFYTACNVLYFCSSARGELSPLATEGWEIKHMKPTQWEGVRKPCETRVEGNIILLCVPKAYRGGGALHRRGLKITQIIV